MNRIFHAYRLTGVLICASTMFALAASCVEAQLAVPRTKGPIQKITPASVGRLPNELVVAPRVDVKVELNASRDKYGAVTVKGLVANVGKGTVASVSYTLSYYHSTANGVVLYEHKGGWPSLKPGEQQSIEQPVMPNYAGNIYTLRVIAGGETRRKEFKLKPV